MLDGLAKAPGRGGHRMQGAAVVAAKVLGGSGLIG
jgi:hypothetical protein